VLRAITGAGWEPIPHTRSSDSDVWIERWGPGPQGAVYLTVYNASERERRTTLSIQTAELGLEGSKLNLTDRLSGSSWSAPIQDGICSVELTAPPEQVRVLQLIAR
jgi:hypothetical protein